MGFLLGNFGNFGSTAFLSGAYWRCRVQTRSRETQECRYELGRGKPVTDIPLLPHVVCLVISCGVMSWLGIRHGRKVTYSPGAAIGGAIA